MQNLRFLPAFTLSCTLSMTFTALPAIAQDCGLYEAIEPGDTVSAIAARCGTTTDAIFAANPEIDAYDLQIGGVLRLQPDAGSPGTNARAIYDTNLLGNGYSPSTTCMGQELQVFFDADQVTFGETRCAIAAMAVEGNRLRLDLVKCAAEGSPAPDRIVYVERNPGNAIAYYSAGGTDGFRLERCTDVN